MPVRDLADDFYYFDARNYALVGRRKRHTYRLGDNIKVQVARADLQRKQLDFALIDENNPPKTVKQLNASAKPRPDFEKPGKKKKSRRR